MPPRLIFPGFLCTGTRMARMGQWPCCLSCICPSSLLSGRSRGSLTKLSLCRGIKGYCAGICRCGPKQGVSDSLWSHLCGPILAFREEDLNGSSHSGVSSLATSSFGLNRSWHSLQLQGGRTAPPVKGAGMGRARLARTWHRHAVAAKESQGGPQQQDPDGAGFALSVGAEEVSGNEQDPSNIVPSHSTGAGEGPARSSGWVGTGGTASQLSYKSLPQWIYSSHCFFSPMYVANVFPFNQTGHHSTRR